MLSILASLLAHAIVAGNLAYGTNEGAAKQAIHSTRGILANLVLAETRATEISASSTTRPLDKAAAIPVIPAAIPAPPDEEQEESLGYASPDSIEQMATVMNLGELPLPTSPLIIEGVMRIKVFINEDGMADNVELLESNFAENYTSTLIEAFKSARFNPGISGGKAIKSWRIVEIDYSSS